ncbi:MAG TPA: hypothetical protein VGS19_27310 [Streptosporangiaceae bacterium]|nr:hypothetical protein [Streptosporangiaceae bacterium]
MFPPIPQTRDYHIRMPMDRWVKTACENVGCEQWRNGWESSFDESMDCGLTETRCLSNCRWLPGGVPCGACSAAYVRQFSGRTFVERRTEAGLTVFLFEPHQRCFAEHRTRPARLLVHEGGQTREHVSFADLAEDYTEHTGHLADQAQRG